MKKVNKKEVKDYLLSSMKVYKGLIIFWTLFIGLGAVFGSCMFFFDPDNGFIMGELLPVMKDRLPFGEVLFSNFIFSGISLLIVNGISNLTAFYFILKNKKIGYVLGFIFGITLMLWISIQFYVFAPNLYAIDVFFFIFGLLQFICGFLAYVNYSELEFTFNENDYPNINQESKDLVVYFSRMGYTKKVAYERANALKCEIIEIIPKEKIKGILGFWWCGRFGMSRMEMDMALSKEIDFTKYENVYLFTPIWVFAISAPALTFINKYSNKIKALHINTVHFCSFSIKGIKLDNNINNNINKTISHDKEYICHFGKYKEKN